MHGPRERERARERGRGAVGEWGFTSSQHRGDDVRASRERRRWGVNAGMIEPFPIFVKLGRCGAHAQRGGDAEGLTSWEHP